jgi:uncharacterized protein with NAD-binding domain and iron-sulfur cluster
MEDGRICGITFEKAGAKGKVGASADYYLLAVPVERAANLVNEEMLASDPSLKNIIKLSPNVEWMNGIQFYLNEEVNLNHGHTMYTDSHWALTSVSQVQFWPDYDLSRRGSGQVVSILSVDISNWVAAGNFNNKSAKDCSKEEIKEEVWQQLKAELNYGGADLLRDDMLEDYYLDEDVRPTESTVSDAVKARLAPDQHAEFHKMMNLEPLLVNQVDTWAIRPNAYTGIGNLFLASDYVKTNTDLATMEGANEAARRAVNSILQATDSDAHPCKIWELDTPFLLEPLQALDALNFAKGMRWKNVY